MSFSWLDEVIMTTGRRFQSGCCLISASTSSPLMRGMFRSSKTRSGRGAEACLPSRRRKAIACSPSSTQWTRRFGMRPSRSVSIVSSASSELSSTRSSSTGLPPLMIADIGSTLRQGRGGCLFASGLAVEPRHLQPERLDPLDGQGELVEVGRLLDAAVDMPVVGLADRLLGVERGQQDDRDEAEALVLLDVREHLVAVLPRQVQVEQDQVGAQRGAKGAVAAQV